MLKFASPWNSRLMSFRLNIDPNKTDSKEDCVCILRLKEELPRSESKTQRINELVSIKMQKFCSVKLSRSKVSARIKITHWENTSAI